MYRTLPEKRRREIESRLPQRRCAARRGGEQRLAAAVGRAGRARGTIACLWPRIASTLDTPGGPARATGPARARLWDNLVTWRAAACGLAAALALTVATQALRPAEAPATTQYMVVLVAPQSRRRRAGVVQAWPASARCNWCRLPRSRCP